MSIRKMKAKVSTKFNLIVSVTQCRNARRHALDEIEGCLIEHYGKVWSYGEEITRTNPGSTVKIDVNVMPDSTTYFSKIYVCFKGVKDGWIAACRRVIGVDGCFLKGICRGQLLATIGMDANNHIFPIAWAVVEVENKETWKWFLDLLLDDIEMRIVHGLTLISDQHKRLSKKGFQQHNIDNVLSTSMLTSRKDSKAFFEVDRACDAYENGISECFNSIIDLARKRPLITMLEEIRIYAMERMYKMLLEGQSWGNLKIYPSIRLKISKLKKHQRFWGVIHSGIQQYEVRLGNDGYAVDLNNNTCGCRSWQVSGIPCVHGVASISYLNRNAEDYVAPWFHTTMFLTCYNHTINPLNGSSMWPEVTYMKPLPPQKRRETSHTRSTCLTRPKDAASTSLPKKKKANKCKIEKGIVEPVQEDPIQVEAHAQPDDDVQVDDPAPHVDVHVYDPVNDVPAQHVDVHVDDPVNDVPAQPVATGKRTRKYSERITKIGLRSNALKKEGSIDHHPLVLE
ncbi:unnamed protein product [Lactuca saligna]|uniref:SWIM-type domain-containing protein n=1 Tax=Lactuca saligna TaxID=75948 RepID=A0AA36EA76_LACSI|nr:unnamed protein product [Lactuca saligna]